MSHVAPAETIAERMMRKVRWRILPLVFVMYVVCFLDRANVSYAKLTMTDEPWFSEAAYGFGAGVFFIGYLLLEIPGALIVERYGARRWMARILVSWGVCTMLVGCVNSAAQFYGARFLLGAAEAGFFPGIIVYLNQWFPRQYRAGVMARFIMASPVALAIGGPISAPLLNLDWLGLAGWRWVFVIEGLPRVALGLLTLFIMTDRPRQAAWLTREKRDWLSGELDAENRRKARLGTIIVWWAFRQRNVVVLAAITMFANIGIAGFFLWLPSTVKAASQQTAPFAAAVSGLPFLVAVLAQHCCSWSSDRTSERHFHTAVPLILAACVFPITVMGNLSFRWLLFWLCASSFAIYGFGPPFWVLPTLTLGESAAAAAAAVGFINCFSAVGGFVGPIVVGSFLEANVRFALAVIVLSGCFFAAGSLTFALKGRRVEEWALESAEPVGP